MRTKYYFYRMTSDTGNAPCVYDGGKDGKGYKYTKGLLTLACCKGGRINHYSNHDTPVEMGLRHTIGKEHEELTKNGGIVYVVGIMKCKRPEEGDRVVYIAKITNVLSMKEYFSNTKYQTRKDCIYRWNNKDVCEDCEEKKRKNQKKEPLTWNLKRRCNFNPAFHGPDSGYSHGEESMQRHKDELGKYVLLSTDFIYFGATIHTIEGEIKEYMPKNRETKKYTDSDKIIDCFIKKELNCRTQTPKPTEQLPLENGNAKKAGCQK